jgi:hypothetical protein
LPGKTGPMGCQQGHPLDITSLIETRYFVGIAIC